jgi:hypothetical protein
MSISDTLRNSFDQQSIVSGMRCIRIMVVCSLLSASACSNNGLVIPTYRSVGIELSGSIEGILLKDGNCIRVKSPTKSFVPVWPSGTLVEAEGMRLPSLNGGQLVRLGQVVRMMGGLNPSAGGISNYQHVARCSGEPFLVNTAKET